jgi:hypothetical protein
VRKKKLVKLSKKLKFFLCNFLYRGPFKKKFYTKKKRNLYKKFLADTTQKFRDPNARICMKKKKIVGAIQKNSIQKYIQTE